MAGDWLRLYRQSIDSQVFANAELWRLWCWLLMRAAWKPWWSKDGTKIEPGQLMLGRSSAAKTLKMSKSKIYRLLKLLEKMRQIEQISNSRGTVVTIVNWSRYQSDKSDDRTDIGTPVKRRWNAGETPVNTVEEGKESKEGKEDIYICDDDAIFQPPSPQQVEAYGDHLGYQVDGEQFCAFYESKGWMVGKNKMKAWRAAVVTWKKNDRSKVQGGKADSFNLADMLPAEAKE